MRTRRGWRAIRIGVVAGVLGGAAVAAARVLPKFLARRSFRRLAATKTTEELWPPVPTRSAGAVRVDAPLAGAPVDGDGSGPDGA
ncbi:MAG: hypothetical protein ABSA31_09370 [Acidimicrobiales bacterium]|jgi:hypothetical protein